MSRFSQNFVLQWKFGRNAYSLSQAIIFKPLNQVGPIYSQAKIELDNIVERVKKTKEFQDLEESWYVY